MPSIGRPALAGAAILASSLVLGAHAGWADEPAADDSAFLHVHLPLQGPASVSLLLPHQPADPRALQRELALALGCSLDDTAIDSEEGWSLSARVAPGAGAAPGLVIDLERLRPRLRGEGWRTLYLTVSYDRWLLAELQPARAFTGGEGPVVVGNYAVTLDAPAAAIRVRFGRSPAELLRAGVALAVVWLAVPALTLVLVRRALRGTEPATAWFRFTRARQALVLAGWLGWSLAVERTGLSELVPLATGDSKGALPALLRAALYAVPAAAAALLSARLSHAVVTRVRGLPWTRAEVVRLAAWGQASLVLFVVGLFQARSHARFGLVAMLLCLIAGAWALLRSRRALGIRPQALLRGEVRDRIFALAERAGVRLQQLFIVPTAAAGLANAFAIQGRQVMLSDALLRHLGRRELDAVVAHELAHVQRRHPLLLSLALTLPIVVLLVVAPWIGLGLGPLAIAGSLALSLPVFFLVSRRFEYVADAAAVAVTCDAAALIRALGTLDRLNLIPHRWGRAEGLLLTHPCTLDRAAALAPAAGLAAEVVAEIVETGAGMSEPYPQPEVARAERERVFSSDVRRSAGARHAWRALGLLVLGPTLTAAAVQAGRFTEPARVIVLALGLAGTWLATLALQNRAAMRLYAPLRPALAAHLRGRHGLDPGGAGTCYLGLAPSAEPRLFDGAYDWDLGFGSFEPGRFVYVGEELAFALRPEQVVEVAVVGLRVGWWRGYRVAVTWRADADAPATTLALRPADTPSLLATAETARALAARIQAWRQTRAATAAPADPGPPVFGQVTSTEPWTVVRAGIVAGLALVVIGSLAVAIAFSLRQPLLLLYALLAPVAVQLVNLLPYRRRTSG